jgi:uncharacterized membrane protein YphA (DoxX/SURF4 family)
MLSAKQQRAGVLDQFLDAMLVAGFVAHTGFSAATGGGEYPLTLAVVTAAVGVIGPGRLTVGRLLERAGVRVPAFAA